MSYETREKEGRGVRAGQVGVQVGRGYAGMGAG